MSPAYEFFEASLRRARTQKRVASIFILVICAIGAGWWMLEGHAGDRQMARMLAMSVLGVPVALVIFGLTFRRNRGLEALKDPSQIVWIYGVTKGHFIVKIGVGLASGKLHVLELGDPRRGQEGMALLVEAAPQATDGYSESNRQTFKQNPGALRRAAAASG